MGIAAVCLDIILGCFPDSLSDLLGELLALEGGVLNGETCSSEEAAGAKPEFGPVRSVFAGIDGLLGIFGFVGLAGTGGAVFSG